MRHYFKIHSRYSNRNVPVETPSQAWRQTQRDVSHETEKSDYGMQLPGYKTDKSIGMLAYSRFSFVKLQAKRGMVFRGLYIAWMDSRKNPSRKTVSLYDWIHRADRVLGFFSSRANWPPPPPNPITRRLVYPLPLWYRGGNTLAYRRGGAGGSNSDEGTDTVVLQVYMYFVIVYKLIFIQC